VFFVLAAHCFLLSLVAGWARANVFTFERPPRVHEIALADLTGNGYLDAYLAIGHGSGEPYIHPDYVLFNEGDGRFSDSRQRLGRGLTQAVFLADLNGNGRLDLVTAGERHARIWLNDGMGRFSAGQQIAYNRYETIALGDVTGDGQLDIFVAGVESYQIWRGQGNGRFTADPRANYR
jgi:hypothetical protein